MEKVTRVKTVLLANCILNIEKVLSCKSIESSLRLNSTTGHRSPLKQPVCPSDRQRDPVNANSHKVIAVKNISCDDRLHNFPKLSRALFQTQNTKQTDSKRPATTVLVDKILVRA